MQPREIIHYEELNVQLFFIKHYCNDQIKEYDTGGTCSMHDIDIKHINNVVEARKEREFLEYHGICRKLILKRILKR